MSGGGNGAPIIAGDAMPGALAFAHEGSTCMFDLPGMHGTSPCTPCATSMERRSGVAVATRALHDAAVSGPQHRDDSGGGHALLSKSCLGLCASWEACASNSDAIAKEPDRNGCGRGGGGDGSDDRVLHEPMQHPDCKYATSLCALDTRALAAGTECATDASTAAPGQLPAAELGGPCRSTRGTGLFGSTDHAHAEDAQHTPEGNGILTDGSDADEPGCSERFAGGFDGASAAGANGGEESKHSRGGAGVGGAGRGHCGGGTTFAPPESFVRFVAGLPLRLREQQGVLLAEMERDHSAHQARLKLLDPAVAATLRGVARDGGRGGGGGGLVSGGGNNRGGGGGGDLVGGGASACDYDFFGCAGGHTSGACARGQTCAASVETHRDLLACRQRLDVWGGGAQPSALECLSRAQSHKASGMWLAGHGCKAAAVERRDYSGLKVQGLGVQGCRSNEAMSCRAVLSGHMQVALTLRACLCASSQLRWQRSQFLPSVFSVRTDVFVLCCRACRSLENAHSLPTPECMTLTPFLPFWKYAATSIISQIKRWRLDCFMYGFMYGLLTNMRVLRVRIRKVCAALTNQAPTCTCR
eukprot:353313-Chlamydomonas_euryale.AAC.4